MSKEEYIEHLKELARAYRQMSDWHSDRYKYCMDKQQEFNDRWMDIQDELMTAAEDYRVAEHNKGDW